MSLDENVGKVLNKLETENLYVRTIILCWLLALGVQTTHSQETPPNILWILAEDLSPDLGCYGSSVVRTPVLDALSKKGTRFTRVFATAPVCSPSRTALATGMYQTAINAHHMRYPDRLKNPLPEPVIPLNEGMRQRADSEALIKAFDEYRMKSNATYEKRIEKLERKVRDEVEKW